MNKMFAFTLIFGVLISKSASSSIRNEESMYIETTYRGVKVHGNWCGPGHGGSAKKNIPTTDMLDFICRMHDLCYEMHGSINCKCDNEFIRRAQRIQDPKLKRVAKTMINYINSSPCVGPVIIPWLCVKCHQIPHAKVCGPSACKKCISKTPVTGKAKSNVKKYSC